MCSVPCSLDLRCLSEACCSGKQTKSLPKQLLGVSGVAYNHITTRYDTGIISGILAMKAFKDDFATGNKDSHGAPVVSPSQSSAIVSILSAGTFFGALGSPLMADRIGRRWALIVSCGIFILGVILQAAASAIPMMLAGRFFAGAGVGLVSAISKFWVLFTLERM